MEEVDSHSRVNILLFAGLVKAVLRSGMLAVTSKCSAEGAAGSVQVGVRERR